MIYLCTYTYIYGCIILTLLKYDSVIITSPPTPNAYKITKI